MAYKRLDNLRIENANVLPRPFRNFSGEAGKYNREGDRSFVTTIDDPEMAQKLKADGWNIREYIPKNDDREDATPVYQLNVAVRFGDYPPKVIMICDGVKTRLDEDTINLLDTAMILEADLDIRPYHWELQDGREGIKAYLQNGYFTIANEDPFAAKYAEEEAPIETPF